jgi:hypothetical protein
MLNTNSDITAKNRPNPGSPRMYPPANSAIQVAMNVIIASITDDSGSTAMVKFTARCPAANHVTGSDRTTPVPSSTFVRRRMAPTAPTPHARISGRWASFRSGE